MRWISGISFFVLAGTVYSQPPDSARCVIFGSGGKYGAQIAGDTILPAIYETIYHYKNGIFFVVHEGQRGYIHKTGDFFFIPNPELLPEGESWDELEQNYARLCDCYGQVSVGQTEALQKAKEKEPHNGRADEASYTAYLVIREGNCVWLVDRARQYYTDTEFFVRHHYYWIDPGSGRILKKFREKSEKRKSYETH